MEAKFKIGDRVRVTKDSWGVKKGVLFTVNYIQENFDGSHSYSDRQGYQKMGTLFPYVVPDGELELVNHTGKILIMVDEKDNNKIIARDILTGKTAEAKCNPADEWDFGKGAKLALERLTEPEKPKGWTGKVVCVESDMPVSFTKGNVYNVIKGYIYKNNGTKWTKIIDNPFVDADDVDSYFKNLAESGTRFIEYKGQVTPYEQ